MAAALADVDAILGRQEALLKASVAKCMQNLAAAQRAGSGIGAASRELAQAQRALRDYQTRQAREQAGGTFATMVDAVHWVMAAGYLVKERSCADHLKANVARQDDGSLLKTKVEEYAERTWDNPSRQLQGACGDEDTSHKARLVKATADLAELKVKERMGSLLDAAEEEARDAAVLLGVRRHIEQGIPERVKRMVADLALVWREGMTAEEFTAAAMVRLPEWTEMEMERLADAFDRLAQAGGVE